jgi:outer membrane receptor protein involved in Fe transport
MIWSLLALWPAFGSLLSGQEAKPGNTPEPAKDDDIVYMSPFVVDPREDAGYIATSSLGGTRIRTELKDFGSALTVYTDKFLKDLGATDNMSLLQYTVNTEVGGPRGNFAGLGDSASLNENRALQAPHGNTRVRGLSAADNTRDFITTDIPWDGYNVGRVEIQRGAQAILYGMGSPAGIINVTTSLPQFKNQHRVEAAFGSYGTGRLSGDFNFNLVPRQVALRFTVLDDDQKFRQKPAFDEDRRLFGSIRIDPRVLNKNGFHTQLRASYEHGEINANRPRMLTPVDAITPWFDPDIFNKQGYDAWYKDTYVPGIPGSGAAKAGTPNYNPWVGIMYGVWDAPPAATYDSPHSAAYGGAYLPSGVTTRLDTAGTYIRGIPRYGNVGIKGFNEYAKSEGSGMTGADTISYKDNRVLDSTTFDFWNVLLDGPTKKEWEDFDTFNVALSQTFLNNRLGIEGVYDYQKYERGWMQMLDGWSQAISIDINETIPVYDPVATPPFFQPRANPNFGRPYVATDGIYGNGTLNTKRDNMRATAFGELRFGDFMERSSVWTRILGTHRFTGMLGREEYQTERRDFARWLTDEAYGAATKQPGINFHGRSIAVVTYLDKPLTDSQYTSAPGLRLPGITAMQVPSGKASMTYFDTTWNSSANATDPWVNPLDPGGTYTQVDNPANYAGWTTGEFKILNAETGDIDKLYREAAKSRYIIDSKAFIWQGYFFEGNLVPTFGYREDTLKQWSITAPASPDGKVRRADYSVNVHHPDFQFGGTPITISAPSRSWSIVAHTPEFIRKKLPWNTGISLFYNESSNFKPMGARTDHLGRMLPPPRGETQDYGFVIKTLEDKVSFRVTWYKTRSTLEDIGAAIPNMWILPKLESLGYTFARQIEHGMANPATYPEWRWKYANDPLEWTVDGDPSSQASKDNAQAHARAASDAWLDNKPSPEFIAAWGLDYNSTSWMDGTEIPWSQPPLFAMTGDFESKGMEFELTAQITKSWSISANASKTHATRTNLGGAVSEWIDDRWAFLQGPAGDLRMWWAGSQETIRGEFAKFMAGYNFLKAMDGSMASEVRPWRVNVVTDYSFREGTLKGLNIGLGWRWEDKAAIGYGIKQDPLSGLWIYDKDEVHHSPVENHVDLWVGYQRQLTRKIGWRIQLNVRDIFAEKKLVPIGTQPDGTPAAWRIPETTTWYLQNSFQF